MRAEQKRCSSCGLLKDRTSFYASSTASDGLQTSCRQCNKEYAKERKLRQPRVEPVSSGSKSCTTCHVEKPVQQFRKCATRPDGRQGRCIGCQADASYRSLYGITTEQLRSLIDAQDGRCAFCLDRLDNPQVDHCHETHKVRRILCIRCNMAYGLLRENAETVARLLAAAKEDRLLRCA